jgi:hypothetical protein
VTKTAAIVASVAIGVRSSGLVHSAESDILRLQQILREGYASGFTIFKELLQNAEDAGAKRLVVIGHEGFPDANNPLLRAPGLIVANDGPVLARHMDAITRASGGSKADERSAVGRFGLGQKSVYHLCDAFIALGRVEDAKPRNQLLIMNPWNGVKDANAASTAWPEVTDNESQMLLERVEALGLLKGMALFLPLRTVSLRPGSNLSLSDRNWDPDNAISEIMKGAELAATLCCLRNLETVEIRPITGQGRKFSLKSGTRRLSGPGLDQGEPVIGGNVEGAGFALSFAGRQQWLPDGKAASLLQQKGWDKVFDIHGSLIPPKANPHGAVIVCRSAVNAGTGYLRVRNAVYLPLGEPVLTEPLGAGAHDIDLLIHGYFFVSSDRKKLRDDDHIETQWNAELRREGSLPLLLDALADAFPSLADDKERHALIKALQSSAWWLESRVDGCQGRALARCWPGQKSSSWQVRPARDLLPMPIDAATSIAALKTAWPTLEEWCVSAGITLAFGPALADEDLRWPDAQLAELVRMAGPAAFTKTAVAETLAALLDRASPGSQAQDALADIYRDATALVESQFARTDKLKPLVRHLPQNRVFALPPAVENRDLIRALAAAGSALPVKGSWVVQDREDNRRLGLEEVVDLLVAVEPYLTGKGEAAQQASTVVSYLLRHGPSLDELARHARAQNLQVIPARQMQQELEERLSLGQIASLKRDGLLFDAAPNRELSVLAGAIAAPAVYRLGLRDGGIEDLASAKKSGSLMKVLRQAESFDDPEKCGELAEMLRDDATREELRRLVAREPDLPVDVELIELDQFDSTLDKLVDVLRQGRKDRLVTSAITQHLKKDTYTKIGMRRVDLDNLGEWLTEALRAGTFPALDDAAAIALLNSGIDDAVLKLLPLHKCDGLDNFLPAGQLFIGRIAEVPLRIAPLARLAVLWPDNKANRVQNRLIDRWGPEASILTCLNADEPAQFTTEICDALAQSDELSEDLAARLKSVAWIKAGNTAWRPAQVLDLPLDAEKAFEALVEGRAELILASQLPGGIRDAVVRERLGKVLPSQSDSFAMAFLYAADSGLVGLCLDTVQDLESLRKMARGLANFEADAWPLMGSALRADLPGETIAELAKDLLPPDKPAIVAQLNALAGLAGTGTVGEAARKLYRHGFDRNLTSLRADGGYLPPELLAPNILDEFRRADALALNSEGIAPSSLIARDIAEKLEGDPHQQTATPALNLAGNLTDSLSRAFIPLHNLDMGDGILLALGMLGRDEDTRNLARKWEGQRSFDRICDDLDKLADEQREVPNANQDRLAELRFDAEFPKDGLVRVVSASGTDCIVPLAGGGEVLLIECSQLGLERDAAGYRHVWRLVFGSVEPKDEDDAKSFLDQFVRKLAPALMLGFDRHKQALSELLHSYFSTDQRTLEDTCNDLKEVLHDRLRGLKPGAVMGAAMQEFDRNWHRDREGARETLWLAAQSVPGAAELLAATRRKIGEMGYEPHRVLFELYQNAIDAQAQWQGQGRFKVEVSRDNDRAITCMRVVHWGRPINQPGGDPQKAELEGHRRDLSNMLAINHSAKDGDAVTGRFGLGFKTVHMLADEVRLASAGIAIRILGGMIPADWREGRGEISRFNDRGRKATLIDIPIVPDLQHEAALAWDAFHAAAPLLAALGHGGTIELADGGAPSLFRHDEHELAEGVGYLQLEGNRYALYLNLGDGFRLLMPFAENGPHAFVDGVPQFWHLVPLVGERRRGAWLMEGRFPVDPGRTQFSGSAEAKEDLFGRLGFELGMRLVALHDYLSADYARLARETGLDPAGRDDFWRRMVRLLALDITRQGPERALHGPGRGLAKLLAECPLVPLAFGSAVRASGVQWRLDGAIADPAVRNLVDRWPAIEAFKDSLIDDEIATLLLELNLPRGRKLDLPTLVKAVTGEEGIDPMLADSLAALLGEDVRSAITGEEDSELRVILRERPWLAEDGSWQPIRFLAFSQSSDDAECARARFAPPSGRLSSSYRRRGLELAKFAREQAGHNEPVWQGWSASANSCPARQTAFIQYLVSADQRAVKLLLQAAAWMPALAELAQSSLLNGLSPNERGLLLAKLGVFSDLYPEHIEPKSASSIDSEAALTAIADWWRENREELTAAYDGAVYPEGFSSAGLVDGDEQAWFTILALASFQTLGRTRPYQSRQFVADAIQLGWWQKLASVDPDDVALGPFVERLRAWSDPNAEESYLMWRRCLTDLCMIARHLKDYRRLFTSLPAIVAKEGEVSLRNHLRPAFSQVAARMGVEAAPIASSLGIGANWLVRELVRHGVYSQEQAERILPYGWSSAERVRRLMHSLGLGRFEHGIDQGRLLHEAVDALIGEEARFCGDGDLPLHIITLAKHRSDLADIFQLAGGQERIDDYGYDNDGDDDA